MPGFPTGINPGSAAVGNKAPPREAGAEGVAPVRPSERHRWSWAMSLVAVTGTGFGWAGGG